jgi:hypothetical protein
VVRDRPDGRHPDPAEVVQRPRWFGCPRPARPRHRSHQSRQIRGYIGARDNKLHAFDQNGMLVWDFTTGIDGDVQTAPVFGPDGSIFYGGVTRIHSLDKFGNLQWVQGLDSYVYTASPVLAPSGAPVRRDAHRYPVRVRTLGDQREPEVGALARGQRSASAPRAWGRIGTV